MVYIDNSYLARRVLAEQELRRHHRRLFWVNFWHAFALTILVVGLTFLIVASAA